MAIEKRPASPVPRGTKPENSIAHRVRDGESWHTLAERYGIDAQTIIRANFATTNPDEVNWYLHHYVGCVKQTPDGKNWMFSSGANPGVIYIPPKSIEMDPLLIQGDTVTKDPTFTTDTEIQQENERRKKAIEQFLQMPAEEIRAAISCQLDTDIPRGLRPPPGEILYLVPRWLIRPEDTKKHDSLLSSQAALLAGPGMPSDHTLDMVLQTQRELDEIYRRGSDHIRASVVGAAGWACVPAVLLAAVLQNENSPKASGLRRGVQALERNIQGWIGRGSTGLGNVKPETLREVTELFRRYYKKGVLRPGVKDAPQNDNAETDIYYAAAVLRHALNKAWSAGPRSLNPELSKRYLYYPYFSGTVTRDVAIRAMGHYNGMGDAARTYGETGMARIEKQMLHFLPPTGG